MTSVGGANAMDCWFGFVRRKFLDRFEIAMSTSVGSESLGALERPGIADRIGASRLLDQRLAHRQVPLPPGRCPIDQHAGLRKARDLSRELLGAGA